MDYPQPNLFFIYLFKERKKERGSLTVRMEAKKYILA